LAWTLHLAGRSREARAAADEAQRLDDLTPHRELKLSHQTIYNPQAESNGTSSAALNAEQMVGELRTGAGPEKDS
jgi:hypothetical protein